MHAAPPQVRGPGVLLHVLLVSLCDFPLSSGLIAGCLGPLFIRKPPDSDGLAYVVAFVYLSNFDPVVVLQMVLKLPKLYTTAFRSSHRVAFQVHVGTTEVVDCIISCRQGDSAHAPFETVRR